MINTIRLKDFQSHKDSTFEFIPGVNVITGVSGVGKSSVIRALNYVFTNKKPNGVEYKRRPDAKGFEIELDVDGHKIKRVKGTKTNEYHIDGEVYKDIGVTVPDKLYEVTKIKPIKVATDEFNVQLAKQFDPHFLMFLPDSSKVKFLNRLSGAHILDIALKETSKDLVALEKDKLTNENELTQVQTTINGLLEIIDPIKLVLKDAKEKYEVLAEDAKRLEALKQAKSHLDAWLKQRKEYDSIKYILSQVNIEGFEAKANRLRELKELYQDFITTYSMANKVASAINQINLLDVSGLEEKKERLDKLIKLCYNYNDISNEMADVEKQMEDLDGKIEKQILTVKLFLENTPICPTCNSKITATKIKQIIGELSK